MPIITSKLFEVGFSDDNSHNMGNYKNGQYSYEILSMLYDQETSEEDKQVELDEIVDNLTNDPLSVSELSAYIMNMSYYASYKAIYNKSLDRNRRIANSVYSAITCKSCSSNKVITNTIQERGLDEPSTVYVKCNNCYINYKTAE